MFYKEKINSDSYIQLIMTPFFRELQKENGTVTSCRTVGWPTQQFHSGCIGRGIHQIVENSWIVVPTVCRFESVWLSFVGECKSSCEVVHIFV
jgi:hypothetical protein